MIDPRLEVPNECLLQLQGMQAHGASLEEMVSFLQGQGLQAPRAKIALVSAGVAGSTEAKRAIHGSQAYAFRRKADEAFERSLVDTLEKLKAEDCNVAAA